MTSSDFSCSAPSSSPFRKNLLPLPPPALPTRGPISFNTRRGPFVSSLSSADFFNFFPDFFGESAVAFLVRGPRVQFTQNHFFGLHKDRGYDDTSYFVTLSTSIPCPMCLTSANALLFSDLFSPEPFPSF